jgi:hypothetical protein
MILAACLTIVAPRIRAERFHRWLQKARIRQIEAVETKSGWNVAIKTFGAMRFAY